MHALIFQRFPAPTAAPAAAQQEKLGCLGPLQEKLGCSGPLQMKLGCSGPLQEKLGCSAPLQPGRHGDNSSPSFFSFQWSVLGLCLKECQISLVFSASCVNLDFEKIFLFISCVTNAAH